MCVCVCVCVCVCACAMCACMCYICTLMSMFMYMHVNTSVLFLHFNPCRTSRQCSKDVVVKGVTIPKGTVIAFPIYYLHHNPELWQDPEKFDPERYDTYVYNTVHRWSLCLLGSWCSLFLNFPSVCVLLGSLRRIKLAGILAVLCHLVLALAIVLG